MFCCTIFYCLMTMKVFIFHSTCIIRGRGDMLYVIVLCDSLWMERINLTVLQSALILSFCILWHGEWEDKRSKKSTEENIEAASHCAHFYCLVCFSFIFLFNSFECERITSHKILYYIITFVITKKEHKHNRMEEKFVSRGIK